MKVNKYFPFAFLYFFVNSLALPFGVTYTVLLAPFFYVWILLTRKKEVLLPFIAMLAPFIFVQVLFGDVVRKVYFFSLANLILVYIFCQAVYTFLIVCQDVEKIFRRILVINFFLCLLAIIFYFTPYYNIFWIEQNLTEGISDFRRMKLFTYEASYYATLLVPIFCFYTLQYLFRQNTIKGWLLLPMIFLPYVLSFSFGVMGALLVSIVITYIIHFRALTRKKRVFNTVVFGAPLLLLGGGIVYFLLRESFFVLRLQNIYTGNDLASRGRTSDAFLIAKKLLAKRNEYWGIGLGQIKILGEDVLRSYYQYTKDFVATIPNAAAETFAVFGWIGLFLRLFIELFFFFYTKVWTNHYRLWLFLFIFIFQFMGSFITNIAEYVIWIMAFTNVFTQFDVQKQELKTSMVLAQ